MHTLLSLPREVRDRILQAVIENKRDAPANLTPDDPNRRQFRNLKKMQYLYSYVRYESDWNALSSICSVLLTNRQLYTEMKDAMRLYPRDRVCYDLDVMFGNPLFDVTWLRVPILTTKVDTVRTQIRSFPQDQEALNRSKNLFVGGDGSPPSLEWCFYGLLVRFLCVGATGEQPQADLDVDRVVTIKTLELDIKTPEQKHLMAPEGKGQKWLSKQAWPHFSDDEENCARFGSIIRPEWLREYVTRMIRKLLAMGYYTASFGGILYERIERIIIMQDGVVTDEIDLAQRLASVQFNDSFGGRLREERPRMFAEWKERAFKLRQERGLRVILPESAAEEL